MTRFNYNEKDFPFPYITLQEQSAAPSLPNGTLIPDTGKVILYIGTDGVPVFKTDTGTPIQLVTGPITGGSTRRRSGLFASGALAAGVARSDVAPDAAGGTVASGNLATGPFVTTISAAGAGAGLVSAADLSRRDWQPDWSACLDLGPNVTAIQYWFGLFSANPENNVDLMTGASLHGMGFRYDTTADGTAFLRCVTNDAVGPATVTTTTVAVTLGLRLKLRIQCQTVDTILGVASVRFYVNDTLVATHTATLPTATQTLLEAMRVYPIGGVAKRFSFNRSSLEQLEP